VATCFTTHYAPEDPDQQQLPQDALSKIKRLLRIETTEQQLAGPDQPKDERPADLPLTKGPAKGKGPQPQQSGKGPQGPAFYIPPQFLLDEVLDQIRARNKKGEIYFGESEAGAVFIPMNKMYHVFDMSKSGRGKSNRFRLALMQMAPKCETYYINPLAAPIKPVKDERKLEIWQPIFDRLTNGAPITEATQIRQALKFLVQEIDRRHKREQRQDFRWYQKPVFIFMDELPKIYEMCPDAPKFLNEIARMGRQYCIFLWIASQTARVEDIGLNPDVQDQFNTRIYGGGDRTSAERIMNGSIPKDLERALRKYGEGLTLMLAEEVDELAFVRSPLVTNEALFDYLNLEPFCLEEWLPDDFEDDEEDEDDDRPVLDLSRDFPQNLSQGLLRDLSRDLSQGQKSAPEAENQLVKDEARESRESVEGLPHHDAIMEAMEALEKEGKALTINAITKRAGISWRLSKEVEQIAIYYGINLAVGTGRPVER
jgi:hypothetical protein